MTRHLRTYRLVFATAIFATAIALTGIGRADSSEQFELREATIADIQAARSEEHTSELQSRLHLVCRLLLEKKKKTLCTHVIQLCSTSVQSDAHIWSTRL